MVINQPFVVTNRENEFDVVCTVKGGGLSGQAGAIKHGIAKALNEYEPELRTVLKQAGFLTRDDRVVERKNTVKLRLVVLTNSLNVNRLAEYLKKESVKYIFFFYFKE